MLRFIPAGPLCRLCLSSSKQAENGRHDAHEPRGARDVGGVVGSAAVRGRRRGAAAARVGAGGEGAGAARVRLGAGAGVGALDDVVLARQGLEGAAGRRDVARGLEVEGAADVLEAREGDAVPLLETREYDPSMG